ncbi:MAG TPA: nitroreductase family deazaflavin-dependent oxidoreductase [Kouleothrix sp.]|uniref:nitroreductase family deazaflavin-dependent oxidoreductase n=1 Tax=Kouleothrix sp. TaxID=2779161 RepID=UPI002C4F6163|nr:nitroreductase family deazaflavin-dependent oxidoreductase [Kouleothrix sp.]
MRTDTPPASVLARRAFRAFNRFMVLLWRLGLGPWLNAWPSVGGRIMVLTHTGRASGQRRRTPLNYTIADGDIFCAAGFGPGSDWYRNILRAPDVELWLPDGWWAGVAEDVSGCAERLPLLRAVLRASGFAARLAGIDPDRLDDAALARATSGYCLVRIRRAAARTGPGGPGDMAWLWPSATLLLLALRLRPRRARL